MFGISAPPTGLIGVTNLDPQSEVLASEYATAIPEFAANDPDDAMFHKFVGGLTMFPTRELSDTGLLTRLLRES